MSVSDKNPFRTARLDRVDSRFLPGLLEVRADTVLKRLREGRGADKAPATVEKVKADLGRLGEQALLAEWNEAMTGLEIASIERYMERIAERAAEARVLWPKRGELAPIATERYVEISTSSRTIDPNLYRVCGRERQLLSLMAPSGHVIQVHESRVLREVGPEEVARRI